MNRLKPISAASPLENFSKDLKNALTSFLGKSVTVKTGFNTLESYPTISKVLTKISQFSSMRVILIEEKKLEEKKTYEYTVSKIEFPYKGRYQGSSDQEKVNHLIIKNSTQEEPERLYSSTLERSNLLTILMNIKSVEEMIKISKKDVKKFREKLEENALVKRELHLQEEIQRIKDSYSFKGSSTPEIFHKKLQAAFKNIDQNNAYTITLEKTSETSSKDIDLFTVHRQFRIIEDKEKDNTYQVSVIYDPSGKNTVNWTSIFIRTKSDKEMRPACSFQNSYSKNLTEIVKKYFLKNLPEEKS